MRTASLAAGIATLALGLGIAPAQEKRGLDPQLAKEIRKIVREEVRAALRESRTPVAAERKIAREVRRKAVAIPAEPQTAHRTRTLVLTGEPGKMKLEGPHGALLKLHEAHPARKTEDVHVKVLRFGGTEHGRQHCEGHEGDQHGMELEGLHDALLKLHGAHPAKATRDAHVKILRGSDVSFGKGMGKAMVIKVDGATIDIDTDAIRAHVLETLGPALENLDIGIDVKALRLGGTGHGEEHCEGHGQEHGEEHCEGHGQEHGEEHCEGHGQEHGEEHCEGHEDDDDTPRIRLLRGSDGQQFRVMLQRAGEDVDATSTKAKRIEFKVLGGDEAQVWIQQGGKGMRMIRVPAEVHVEKTHKTKSGEAEVKVLRLRAPKKDSEAEGCCGSDTPTRVEKPKGRIMV